MQKLHFYTGAGYNTPSGIKVCIFGATSHVATKMATYFFTGGTPVVMCHRGPLDYLLPGDDLQFTKSNPYYKMPPIIMGFDSHNFVTIN